MAETINEPQLEGEKVITAEGAPNVDTGHMGLETQVSGQAATVSGVQATDGGIREGGLILPYVERELYKFQSDDTPLMQLMLSAKRVEVKSPLAKHYMLDEPKHKVTTTDAVEESSKNVVELPLDASEADVPTLFMTLLCKGVDGYDAKGQERTVGKELMLFVSGRSESTGLPIVRAVNGPKTNDTDMYCTIPAIPAGTELIILSTACYETQMYVEPDLVMPVPRQLFLQKRIMNQVISDYFKSQLKHEPYNEALIAEQAIANFKKRCNRSLWIGRPGHMRVQTAKGLGVQDVYFAEGIRWQFFRELTQTETWDYNRFIGLAKMFYTGEDVPKTAICLCGKNFLESIQKIDWSRHPEVRIKQETNRLGWSITRIHTVFGDFDFKREPTLDYIGYSNSAAIIGEDRLVHYTRVAEHRFDDKVEGEEAHRTGIILWDALALKGACHIWVNGETGATGDGDSSSSGGFQPTRMQMVDCTDISEVEVVDGYVYYFLNTCKLTDDLTASAGDLYLYKDGTWTVYDGQVFAR